MPGNVPGLFKGTAMPTRGWWAPLWTLPPTCSTLLNTVGLGADMGVIELWCGDGWFTVQIAKLARHMTAIDIDADRVKVARQRLAEDGMANCSFIFGVACVLGRLVREPVDLVFRANTFHGVPARSRLVDAVQTLNS